MSCLRLLGLVILHSEGACVSKLSPFLWLGAVTMAGHHWYYHEYVMGWLT